MNFFRFLKSKSFFIQIGIAIVSVSLLIMGIKWWLSFTTNHDQKIQVPDLNKMSLSNVETKLKELIFKKHYRSENLPENIETVLMFSGVFQSALEQMDF